MKKRVINSWEAAAIPLPKRPKRSTPLCADVEQELLNVTEVKDFAGQKVEVTKQVVKGSREAQGLKAKKGLDAVLAALKGPNKMSTMTKSQIDWDKDKAAEGDADELRQYTKDGYLTKQKFLQESEMRVFEKEKAERNTEREKERIRRLKARDG